MSTLRVAVTALNEAVELSGDYLIDQLESYDTLSGKAEVEGQTADVSIPFHAIDYAVVSSRGVTPVTPSDANCVGGVSDCPDRYLFYHGVDDGEGASYIASGGTINYKGGAADSYVFITDTQTPDFSTWEFQTYQFEMTFPDGSCASGAEQSDSPEFYYWTLMARHDENPPVDILCTGPVPVTITVGDCVMTVYFVDQS